MRSNEFKVTATVRYALGRHGWERLGEQIGKQMSETEMK